MGKPLYGGVDVGSSATKVVLADGDGIPRSKALVDSGMDFASASEAALVAALEEAGAAPGDVAYVVSTGYGLRNVEFSREAKTEIACHARGAFYHVPGAMSIIDIGGQDNKVIEVDAQGNRVNFKMNRKCAAGTGAFLEEIARRMDVPLEEMERLARGSTEHVEIGSFCTVFSATEILALIRRGVKRPDIARGAFRSVVKRVTEMATFNDTVVATGGVVAHNPIVVEILGEAIGREVKTPPDPQFAGAFGAALYAVDESGGRAEQDCTKEK